MERRQLEIPNLLLIHPKKVRNFLISDCMDGIKRRFNLPRSPANHLPGQPTFLTVLLSTSGHCDHGPGHLFIFIVSCSYSSRYAIEKTATFFFRVQSLVSYEPPTNAERCDDFMEEPHVSSSPIATECLFWISKCQIVLV